MKKTYDIIIIGGGPAGLAAAIQAKKDGVDDIVIIERDKNPGGILPQCIHNGFGSVLFKKDYPGPYYAQKFIDEARDLHIDILLDTMVLDITQDKKVYATSDTHGYLELQAKALILAMGCRERTRAQIKIPGTRPAGVFTAGTVQRFVNIEGYMPGKKFVVLGSGDIGMIMARRLTLEGASVERVLEIMPFLTGLRRNYVQCLQDFGIKLQLQHTIKRILGDKRVEGVEIVKVDDCFHEIPGTEEIIPCDALLLSVGLIPENELSRKAGLALDPVTGGLVVDERMQTNVPGIFGAGNIVTIHDLVDYVTKAGYIAGKSASSYVKEGQDTTQALKKIRLLKDAHVHSVVPHFISVDEKVGGKTMIQLRVNRVFDTKIVIELIDATTYDVLATYKENYARPAEMIVKEVDTADLVRAVKNSKVVKVRVNEVENGGKKD